MTIKLLLVEDDRVDQLAFERMVAREDLPYEYQIAGSAREARELLANQTFDVVLLDYLLGDATGFEILPGISEQTPVIFTTGAGDVFLGAMTYAMIHDWPFERSMRFANTAAALSCRDVGGRGPIPEIAAVEAAMEG